METYTLAFVQRGHREKARHRPNGVVHKFGTAQNKIKGLGTIRNSGKVVNSDRARRSFLMGASRSLVVRSKMAERVNYHQ
jgi:hypothetical protein